MKILFLPLVLLSSLALAQSSKTYEKLGVEFRTYDPRLGVWSDKSDSIGSFDWINTDVPAFYEKGYQRYQDSIKLVRDSLIISDEKKKIVL